MSQTQPNEIRVTLSGEVDLVIKVTETRLLREVEDGDDCASESTLTILGDVEKPKPTKPKTVIGGAKVSATIRSDEGGRQNMGFETSFELQLKPSPYPES